MTAVYDDAERRKLRELLVQNGASPDRVGEIVDLACHATEQCLASFHRSIQPGVDSGIRLAATGLALELALTQLNAQMERLVLLGHLFGFQASAPKKEGAHG